MTALRINQSDLNPDGTIPENLFIDPKYNKNYLEVDLTRCNLEFSEILHNQLIQLENTKVEKFKIDFLVDVIWPLNFGRNDEITATKKRINQIIGGDSESPIIIMFSRLLSGFAKKLEEMEAKKFTKKINDFLDIVEKQPLEDRKLLIELMNNKANDYVQSCNNRPLVGFFHIAFMALVVSADNFSDKVRRGKELLVMDISDTFTVDKDFAGSYSDAEKMLSLVDYMGQRVFGENGKEFVSLVPEDVKNGYSLDSQIMDNFIQIAETILHKSNSRIIEDLCNMVVYVGKNEQVNIWGVLAFPGQTREISEKYQPRIDELKDLLTDAEKPIPNELLNKNDKGELIAVDSTNRNEFLSQKLTDLNQQKQTEIKEMARAETKNRIPRSSFCGTVTKKISGENNCVTM